MAYQVKAFDLFFAWATEKVAWCSCMGIRYHFNTKYFIINSKITALCNRNHSAVLAYIYTHMHTSSCLLEIWLMMTHTYTHLYPRFIACTDAYFSFMFTGAFPLHACGVTCNLHTYFTCVRRVFLVETAVLQTVL